MDRDFQINKLKEYYTGKEEVVFGYLFGSRAKNQDGRGKDLDIGIYVCGIEVERGFEYKLEETAKLEGIFQKAVDLVLINEAPPLLRHEIFRYGVAFKDEDHAFLVEFRVRSFYQYLDQMYIVNTYFEKNKARIQGGCSMVSMNIIKRKINAIEYNLKRIVRYQHLSLEEFLADEDARDIVAHNLFVMLQNVIDIGTHLISDAGLEEPSFLSEIPDLLAKEKVIGGEMVKPLKSMIGLRNIIAHEYGDLNFKIIYGIVKENLGDINSFLGDVVRYCKL